MNVKNFDYLMSQLKFTGFDDALESHLKESIAASAGEFHIDHKEKLGNDSYSATLHFKRSDVGDMYFFNKYHLEVTSEKTKKLISRNFYVNRRNNITIKEGYNLLNGRSINKDLVNKEGLLYNSWLQLDLVKTDKNGNYQMKQYHANYGYDLRHALAKLPIQELLNETEKARLLESLQGGNLQMVTCKCCNTEEKYFIEASPQFKTINIYNGSMERVIISQKSHEKQGGSVSNSLKGNRAEFGN